MGFHRLCHFCLDPAPQSASCTSAWPWALPAVQGCLTGTKICVQFAPRHDCHVYSVITSICSIGHSANVYLVLFATPGMAVCLSGPRRPRPAEGCIYLVFDEK